MSRCRCSVSTRPKTNSAESTQNSETPRRASSRVHLPGSMLLTSPAHTIARSPRVRRRRVLSVCCRSPRSGGRAAASSRCPNLWGTRGEWVWTDWLFHPTPSHRPNYDLLTATIHICSLCVRHHRMPSEYYRSYRVGRATTSSRCSELVGHQESTIINFCYAGVRVSGNSTGWNCN